MFRFLVPFILATSVNSIQERLSPADYSAASESQTRFAIENKYDDTGPGAKEPEYAYKTYKTLDEALVGYIDDPDTKLPEFERAKAVQKLLKPNEPQDEYYSRQELQRFLPKPVEEYTGYKPKPRIKPIIVTRYSFPDKKIFYHDPKTKVGILDLRDLDENDIGFLQSLRNEKRKTTDPFRLQKVQSVKSNPLSIAHFTKEPQKSQDQFNPNPQYTFSYGVHDKLTGDSKSAHETRDGSNVRGYYTFIDADGKQRTVHYIADEKQGFRATVQRTQTNTQ